MRLYQNGLFLMINYMRNEEMRAILDFLAFDSSVECRPILQCYNLLHRVLFHRGHFESNTSRGRKEEKYFDGGPMTSVCQLWVDRRQGETCTLLLLLFFMLFFLMLMLTCYCSAWTLFE